MYSLVCTPVCMYDISFMYMYVCMCGVSMCNHVSYTAYHAVLHLLNIIGVSCALYFIVLINKNRFVSACVKLFAEILLMSL